VSISERPTRCSSAATLRIVSRVLAAPDRRPDGRFRYLNSVSKYVVSSTLEDPEWEITTVLRGGLVDEVQA
jgi:hypothetical protein